MLADPRITAESVTGMKPSKTGIRNPVPVDIPTYPSQRPIRVAACDTDLLRERGAAPKQDRVFRATDAVGHEAPFKLHELAKLRAQLDSVARCNPALCYAIVDLGL
jgi:hypothetical protein